MSGIYPSIKTKLIEWALSSPPASMGFRMALVDDSFVFDATDDALTDLTGVLYDDIAFTNLTYTEGRIRADNFSLTTLAINDNITGIIIYLSWLGGSQLICHINETTDASLPVELLTDGVEIHWNASGIFQL